LLPEFALACFGLLDDGRPPLGVDRHAGLRYLDHDGEEPLFEVVGLRARLDEILEDVLDGEITTAKGQVAATIIGVSLRSFEVEKKQKEFLELERRLSEVEKMYARKGASTDSDGYSFGSGRWAR
jgi:hypothetical protein